MYYFIVHGESVNGGNTKFRLKKDNNTLCVGYLNDANDREASSCAATAELKQGNQVYVQGEDQFKGSLHATGSGFSGFLIQAS